jgi:type I restriction-modification system DNA methylase subunit
MTVPHSASSLLEKAYDVLGYREGTLLDATELPSNAESNAWLEKGEWLRLAHKAGIKKVFFVNNDPVIVFADFPQVLTVEEQREVFRQVWCMARPQCLFMAYPGELRVDSLGLPPAKDNAEWEKKQPLALVHSIAQVAEQLNKFSRDQVESGVLFDDARFGGVDNRADTRLIKDLQQVRRTLLDTGLELSYVHSLIGRAIFIRYLEDRDVLLPEYFQAVAKGNPEWENILGQEPERPDLVVNAYKRRFDRVLRDKDFTFALFDKLTEDFNGDIFVEDEAERLAIEQPHLDKLRGLLLSDTDPHQPSLFFWAYQFDIIPTELISSIYEEFYHHATGAGGGATREDDKGTHYTPSVLVEYMLSQLLPENRLATNPRVLDPACGSGIFLVEAFRRIVRYRVWQSQRRLTPNELRQIIRSQITGIEINEEAARVAAFSLYLALLHYQEPHDIRHARLPNLLYSEEHVSDENHYGILFNVNTFNLMDPERHQIYRRLEESKRFEGRLDVERLSQSKESLPLEPNSFDIIVGNPPWGFQESASDELRGAQEMIRLWRNAFEWPIGDKELSQAFVARSLSLLKPGGECGLLVSTGMLHNRYENSENFRKRWLSEAIIYSVVNFAHVRRLFFSANAPFAFVHFGLGSADPSHYVHYWSAKRTRIVEKVPALILDLTSLRQVAQAELACDYTRWKTYWWGNHRDANLVTLLRLEQPLSRILQQRDWPKPGRGYERVSGNSVPKPGGNLKRYEYLPTKRFRRYGPISPAELENMPDVFRRYGRLDLYDGWRLLIKRGITEANGTDGRIDSRLDDMSYAFRNSIHGIKLDKAEDWERKVLQGIWWSSLPRYFFFMTSSHWGPWHHEIELEEIGELPIKLPADQELRTRIVSIVDRLRRLPSTRSTEARQLSLFNVDTSESDSTLPSDVTELEKRLDDAIFDLYELGEDERDLIRDMCDLGLSFFYRHGNSGAVEQVEHFPIADQGTANDLRGVRNQERGLEGYLYAFLQSWTDQLAPDGEFRWKVIRPRQASMIALVFTAHEKGAPLPESLPEEDNEWEHILAKCGQTLLRPVSRRIYVDGIVRAVTDTEIIIIKRDERRLWTRSIAREDAEATILQAMQPRAYRGDSTA